MDLDSYTQNISTIISGGYITSAIVIGWDLGLFEALKKSKAPMTSEQLADKCQLKERYVQEWLGCMVSSNIVSLDEHNNYFIPEHCKEGLRKLAMSSMLPIVACLIEKAKKCFAKDGPPGYTYNDMPPEIGFVLSLRSDDWRDTIEQLLEPFYPREEPITNILDLGCGSGVLSMALSERFPDANVCGVDIVDINVKNANELAAKANRKEKVSFFKEDAADLPEEWTNSFDWVVLMDVLHDLPLHEKCMQEVMRVLKDDGVVTTVDPNMHSDHRSNVGDIHIAAVGYAISEVMCVPSALSVDGAPGLGMGWGAEKKEKFLTDGGWTIIDKKVLKNPFQLSFTCKKARQKSQS